MAGTRLTDQELGQLVGASSETVNNTLADFAHRGWIRLNDTSVLVSNPNNWAAERARAAIGAIGVTHCSWQVSLICRWQEVAMDASASDTRHRQTRF